MQSIEGEELRRAWESKRTPPCTHPVYDRERTGTADTGRFVCIVCGCYLSETHGRQPLSSIRLVRGGDLMEWTEPSGITYELRLHEHTWWYRPKTQADEEWRKGYPRDFLFR